MGQDVSRKQSARVSALLPRLRAKRLRRIPGVPRRPVSPCLLQSHSNFGTSKWVSGVVVGYSCGEASAVDCRPQPEASFWH
jgi:hypothetical protein